MLLIFSDNNDISTNHVIDWLIYYGTEFMRVNGEDRFKVSSFELSDNNFICQLENENTGKVIDITKLTGVWYRRGNFVFNDKSELKDDFAGIITFAKKEFEVFHEFIMNFLEALPRLDSYFRSNMNKLKVLSIAKSVGLSIPRTFLFQGSFPYTLQGTFITKSIFELFKYEYNGFWYFTPTALIDSEELKSNGLHYNLSLVQNHIEKECDIRVFYLKGKLFSMAIMSQNNEKSKTDFRHYPTEPPMRYFPVLIPNETTKKIKKLMKILNLDSGSIDLILDLQGNFIFLEINPVGQFGMTSIPCNYYIEKEIAKDLSCLSFK